MVIVVLEFPTKSGHGVKLYSVCSYSAGETYWTGFPATSRARNFARSVVREMPSSSRAHLVPFDVPQDCLKNYFVHFPISPSVNVRFLNS